MSLLKKYPSEYRTWNSMKQRCYNPKTPGYHLYGERGIKVCKRWLMGFEYFMKDMGAKPSPEHSLDRKNNNKGYSRQNCRWATREEQGRNRYNNILATFNGKTQTIAAWSKETGIKYSALRERIICGWGDAAFTLPVGRKGRKGRMPLKYLDNLKRDNARSRKIKNESRANHLKWYWWKRMNTPRYKEKLFIKHYATFTMEDVIEYDKEASKKFGIALGQLGDW